MKQGYNPLHLICESCGAPIRYEIGTGLYKCQYCGNTKAPYDKIEKTKKWKEVRQSALINDIHNSKAVFYSCLGCGAKVIVLENEAIGKCAFCNSNLVRKEYEESDIFPSLIIPFEIKEDEAKEKLKKFINKNFLLRRNKVLKHIDELKGYYLPYQFVRGPVECKIFRDVSEKQYHAYTYVDELAVNTSKQLSNEVLDACEPFDWEKSQDFSFGYIAGHKVKIQDINDKELINRVYNEVKDDFIPVVEKTLETKGIDVFPESSSLEELPVLLPFYFIKRIGLCVGINGQNGNVALTFYKTRDRSRFWFIEPLLTAIIIGLITYLLSKQLELTIYAFIAIALIAFTVFSNKRDKHEETIIYSDKKNKKLEDSKTVTPIFKEEIKGEIKEVKIKFFPIGRVIALLLKVIIFNILPLIIVLLIKLINHSPFETLCFRYIGLWLVISVPISIIFWFAYARRDIYDNPVLYALNDNGKYKRVRKNDLKSTIRLIIDLFKDGGLGFGLLLGGLPLLMFIMSIYLMLVG